MSRSLRTLSLTALLLLSSSALRAQSAANLSGHWEGTITVPDRDVRIELDLAKNAKGEFAGTFGNPARNIRGMPLTNVAVEGTTVRFLLKSNAGGTFDGVVSDDGKSISGKFAVAQGGHVLPFSVTRTGDATIAPPIVNAPIGKELEGTWNATVDAEGRQMRLALTLANQSDGTAVGTLVTLNGGSLELPVAIVQQGSRVTIDVRVVGGSFAASLSADHAELAGMWTQGAVTLPMTFKRAPEPAK